MASGRAAIHRLVLLAALSFPIAAPAQPANPPDDMPEQISALLDRLDANQRTTYAADCGMPPPHHSGTNLSPPGHKVVLNIAGTFPLFDLTVRVAQCAAANGGLSSGKIVVQRDVDFILVKDGKLAVDPYKQRRSALKRLCEHEIDMALVIDSDDWTAKDACEASFERRLIAQDPLVFVINKENPLFAKMFGSLKVNSFDDLNKILFHDKTWGDIGTRLGVISSAGAHEKPFNGAVERYLPSPNDGSFSVVTSLLARKIGTNGQDLQTQARSVYGLPNNTAFGPTSDAGVIAMHREALGIMSYQQYNKSVGRNPHLKERLAAITVSDNNVNDNDFTSDEFKRQVWPFPQTFSLVFSPNDSDGKNTAAGSGAERCWFARYYQHLAPGLLQSFYLLTPPPDKSALPGKSRCP